LMIGPSERTSRPQGIASLRSGQAGHWEIGHWEENAAPGAVRCGGGGGIEALCSRRSSVPFRCSGRNVSRRHFLAEACAVNFGSPPASFHTRRPGGFPGRPATSCGVTPGQFCSTLPAPCRNPPVPEKLSCSPSPACRRPS
jgi:hypothetical protein